MSRTAFRPGARVAAILALAAGVAVAACSDVTVPLEDPAQLTFAPALGVDLSRMTRTASGLYYQDLTTGTGARADSGDTVRTYYTGWLASGQQFDALRTGTPLQFILGTRAVVRGWDEGIAGMRVNGRRRLVIPPALGYGPTTNGSIPAGSVLVFDVQVTGVGNTRADSTAS